MKRPKEGSMPAGKSTYSAAPISERSSDATAICPRVNAGEGSLSTQRLSLSGLRRATSVRYPPRTASNIRPSGSVVATGRPSIPGSANGSARKASDPSTRKPSQKPRLQKITTFATSAAEMPSEV